MRRAGEAVEVFWAGECDLAGLLATSLSLSLTLTSPLVFSVSASEGEYLLVPLLVLALLDGEGGGEGLSTCVGLYRSIPFVRDG